MRSHNVVLWYARSVSAVLISSHCARWVTRANWCTSLYYIYFRNTSGHCARWVTRPLIVSRASPCQHAPAGSLRITIKFFTVKCGFSWYYKYMCNVHCCSSPVKVWQGVVHLNECEQEGVALWLDPLPVSSPANTFYTHHHQAQQLLVYCTLYELSPKITTGRDYLQKCES